MDIHLHSSASADWQEPGSTWLDWLHKAEQRGLDIVAITDHNTVAGVASLRREIERLHWLETEGRLRPQERRDLDEYRRLGNEILVLPGFEFTATFGFHILGIFPPQTSVRQLEHVLLTLNIPGEKLDTGSTEVGATADVLTAYRVIRESGGLAIAAHANSTHGVAMRDFPFGGQTKIAYTQDPNLHVLEVTDLESRSTRATARFFNGSKPEYPRRMRCIQGSDAHRLHRDPSERNRLGIGDRVTEIKLPEPAFEAIKKVLESTDFALTRPYRQRKAPFDHVAAAREQGPSIVQSFHERMTRQGGRLHAVLSDAAGFTNTNGGTIYLGVGSRPGPPVGVENVEQAISELVAEIDSKIEPQLAPVIDALESQGRQIVRIQVPEGEDKPYCLEGSRIYLRHEGETVLAVRDEIVQLVRKVLLERGDLVVKPKEEASAESPAKSSRRRRKRSPKPEPSPVASKGPVTSAPAGPTDETILLDDAAFEDEYADVYIDEYGIRPPTIGVQIVDSDDRGDTRYYAIRDLRNGNTVKNVTLKSARRLWRYAISQHEKNPPDPAKINWVGDLGLLRAEKRAGKRRYDFVQRLDDGTLAVYYGVTEEGCDEPWRQFVINGDESEEA